MRTYDVVGENQREISANRMRPLLERKRNFTNVPFYVWKTGQGRSVANPARAKSRYHCCLFITRVTSVERAEEVAGSDTVNSPPAKIIIPNSVIFTTGEDNYPRLCYFHVNSPIRIFHLG